MQRCQPRTPGDALPHRPPHNNRHLWRPSTLRPALCSHFPVTNCPQLGPGLSFSTSHNVLGRHFPPGSPLAHSPSLPGCLGPWLPGRFLPVLLLLRRSRHSTERPPLCALPVSRSYVAAARSVSGARVPWLKTRGGGKPLRVRTGRGALYSAHVLDIGRSQRHLRRAG